MKYLDDMLETEEEARVFILFLTAEQLRHQKDIDDIDRIVLRLKKKWKL